jgi:transcription elongation GreA/GreB family factor
MTLSILATEENWQAFDEAWSQLIQSSEPLDDLIAALEVVGTKRRMARCMVTVRSHVEALREGGRSDEAALLLGAALRGGGPQGEIAELLFACAQEAWGAQAWWGSFCELSGFQPGSAELRKAWMYFDDMRSYQPGIVVFHAAGWGSGEVTAVDLDKLEVAVRFQSGRTDRFPLRTAVEIFEKLPESDLRSQHLRDPEALKKRVKKEPLEVLRSILLRYGGKTSSMTLRNALQQIGIDGPAWTNWWRKARVEAENSEWFRVSGNAARAEVELLRRAVDPIQSLKRQLSHAPDLRTALSRVRDLFGATAIDDGVRLAALDAVATAADDPREALDQRLAAWMLLREHRGATPQPLAQLIAQRAALPTPPDPSVPPPLWVTLNLIPGAREQEQALGLLAEAYGERWMDEAAQHLPHAPPGMANAAVHALFQAGRKAELGRHYASLLARPTRAPFVLISLARMGESGQLEGELPTPVQRALALIELGVHLQESKRGNNVLTRAHQRLVDLLTKGEGPLLRRLLVEADITDLASVRTALQRGVDDQLDSLLSDIALEKGVDLFRSESLPFWKEEKIWTTRAGLARRDAELRELRDKKIPANAEAIARAASYGDLSENSEWDHAIEEQRQLTTAASIIEKEMRIAALLENAPIQEDMVCPGTVVRYRETKTGVENEVVLLGPWDTEPNAISYRAPLASGMLGLHAGDKTVVELPAGPLPIEILSTRPFVHV